MLDNLQKDRNEGHGAKHGKANRKTEQGNGAKSWVAKEAKWQNRFNGATFRGFYSVVDDAVFTEAGAPQSRGDYYRWEPISRTTH